ncbi:hypothetical protein [Hymenobacter volaticus]|uniref:Uncharacterized protein n=1 Tax=Hymenobacter volaticus TaxID=2932254 RepID=A0ABY4GC83_9BACT|nr:hypothetical protein [Hymenobacter volaticus]UOQ68548.1 hypothetical protein MUN86_23870 [Hymenobacter volaticus]
MEHNSPSPRQNSLQHLYDKVGQLMRQGKSNKQVQTLLQDTGLDAQSAAVVTRKMRSQFREIPRSQNRSATTLGALIIGGLQGLQQRLRLR